MPPDKVTSTFIESSPQTSWPLAGLKVLSSPVDLRNDSVSASSSFLKVSKVNPAKYLLLNFLLSSLPDAIAVYPYVLCISKQVV